MKDEASQRAISTIFVCPQILLTIELNVLVTYKDRLIWDNGKNTLYNPQRSLKPLFREFFNTDSCLLELFKRVTEIMVQSIFLLCYRLFHEPHFSRFWVLSISPHSST